MAWISSDIVNRFIKAAHAALPRAGNKQGITCDDPINKEVPKVASKVAQFTLRGDTAHFQYGESGSYEKYDVPATAAMRAYLDEAIANGDSVNSLANSSTQYALVEYKVGRPTFEFVVSQHVVVEV